MAYVTHAAIQSVSGHLDQKTCDALTLESEAINALPSFALAARLGELKQTEIDSEPTHYVRG